jgi:hypothetical protein
MVVSRKADAKKWIDTRFKRPDVGCQRSVARKNIWIPDSARSMAENDGKCLMQRVRAHRVKTIMISST